jgi:hypothetical protein
MRVTVFGIVIADKSEQFLNASVPMLDTEFERVQFTKLLQFLKAPIPTAVIVSGKVIEPVKPVHPSNVKSDILVNPDENFTPVKFGQFEKAPVPTDVTVLGKTISPDKLVQLSKVKFPISVKALGKLALAKLLQF